MSDGIRKITLFSAEQWGEVVEFRFKQRFNCEADGVRNLVAAGLHYYRMMEDPEFAAFENHMVEKMNNNSVTASE